MHAAISFPMLAYPSHTVLQGHSPDNDSPVKSLLTFLVVGSRQLCDRILTLKDSCVHSATGQPYIVSFVGGKDNSPEGLQVCRYLFSVTSSYHCLFYSLDRKKWLPSMASWSNVMIPPLSRSNPSNSSIQNAVQLISRSRPFFFNVLNHNSSQFLLPQNGFTHTFLVEFANEADRDYYVHHDQAHHEFIKTIADVVDGVCVLDFSPGQF